jgi:hypothetical protein
MEHTMEQRVNVNFCVKLQNSSSEMLEILKTVYGEFPGQRIHRRRSPRSKQCWSAFSTSEVSSSLNLYLKGPLLIRNSMWRWLKRLVYAMRSKWGELWRDHSLILHHDNALVHYLFQVSQFLAREGISAMDHPSLDLAPADFWMFPKFKSVLKGSIVWTLRTLNHLWKKFWDIPVQDFITCFEQWLRHWEHSKELEGDYSEKF